LSQGVTEKFLPLLIFNGIALSPKSGYYVIPYSLFYLLMLYIETLKCAGVDRIMYDFHLRRKIQFEKSWENF